MNSCLHFSIGLNGNFLEMKEKAKIDKSPD